MSYTCKSCGAIADEPGHLCNPCGDEKECTFCGTPKVDPKHVCQGKMGAMQYYCEGCGRVATQASHVCKPRAIA